LEISGFGTTSNSARKTHASAHSNKAKRNIAKEALEHIHALGRIFLKQAETEKPLNDVVELEAWCQGEEKFALEKGKQKLGKNENQEALVGMDEGITFRGRNTAASS
jgi:hypothetical protein